MKKFIMGFLPSREAVFKFLCKVVIVLGIAGMFVAMEVITYKETVAWVTDEIVSIIQEDNASFLAQSR